MVTYRVGFVNKQFNTLSEAAEYFNNSGDPVIRLFIVDVHYGAIVRRMDPYISEITFIWKPEILFYLDILEIE